MTKHTMHEVRRNSTNELLESTDVHDLEPYERVERKAKLVDEIVASDDTDRSVVEVERDVPDDQPPAEPPA